MVIMTIVTLVSNFCSDKSVYMEKIKVFRLEHAETGYGPYAYEPNSSRNLYLESYLRDHEEVFGYPEFDLWSRTHDFTQYRFSWLDEVYMDQFLVLPEAIKELGYIVRTYETNDYLVCRDGQVLFR